MSTAYVSGSATANGANYTPGAGSDKYLAWWAGGYSNGGSNASLQDYGGSSMTELQDLLNNLSGGGDPFSMIAGLVDPGTSDATLSLTWSSTPAAQDGFAMTFSGVDQATPIYPTNGNVEAIYTTDTNPALTYSAPAGSSVIYVKIHRQSGTPAFTDPAGFGTAKFTKEFVASPANITVKIWVKDQATEEVDATVSSSMGASTGGVHGVLVLQSAAAGGGNPWYHNAQQ